MLLIISIVGVSVIVMLGLFYWLYKKHHRHNLQAANQDFFHEDNIAQNANEKGAVTQIHTQKGENEQDIMEPLFEVPKPKQSEPEKQQHIEDYDQHENEEEPAESPEPEPELPEPESAEEDRKEDLMGEITDVLEHEAEHKQHHWHELEQNEEDQPEEKIEHEEEAEEETEEDEQCEDEESDEDEEEML